MSSSGRIWLQRELSGVVAAVLLVPLSGGCGPAPSVSSAVQRAEPAASTARPRGSTPEQLARALEHHEPAVRAMAWRTLWGMVVDDAVETSELTPALAALARFLHGGAAADKVQAEQLIELVGQRRSADGEPLRLRHIVLGVSGVAGEPWSAELAKLELSAALSIGTMHVTAALYDLGHWRAQLSPPEIGRYSGGALEIVYRVSPGPRFVLSAVRVEDDGAKPGEAARVSFTHLIGQVARRGPLVERIAAMERAHHDRGHALARVVVQLDFDDDASMVAMLLRVERGALYRIGEVGFEGNRRLARAALLRLVALREGDRYDLSALERGQTRLRSHPQIARVATSTRQGASPLSMDVLFEVEERGD